MRLSLPASAVATLLASISFTSAVKLDDYGGLDLEITRIGDCTSTTKNGDTIAVQYRGTLQSTGEEFDSSYRPGKHPFEFKLGAGMVIQGWDVGLQEMCLGEARRLIIPPEMGYGARGAPPRIPGGAVLIFETELVAINGVMESSPPPIASASTPEEMFGIATAPASPSASVPESSSASTQQSTTASEQATSTPVAGQAGTEDVANAFLPPDVPVVPPPPAEIATGSLPLETATPPEPTLAVPPPESDITPANDEEGDGDSGECHLLGGFAILIQGALGAFALLALVFKRWRETPRRPLMIWFFDVSKQVFGSILLHVMNVFFSMLSGGSFDVASAVKPPTPSMIRRAGDFIQGLAAGRDEPNPCSFYLLNLALDTTIGIPILVLFLRILHALFLHTPLAHPPESLRSGNYGHPPSWRWYLKQSFIYYIALFFMKLFVYFLLKILPWLAWVGDWALRWTEGNEALQIAFTMLIFPLIMNCVQYWVIDSFIKDPAGGSGDYQGVQQDDEDSEGRRDGDDETIVEGDDDEEEEAKAVSKGLKEANPTPIPNYEVDEEQSSGSSRGLRRGGGGGTS